MKTILDRLLLGEDLSFEDTRRLLGDLLSEESDPILVSAFLTALKVKGETPAEIGGAARALGRGRPCNPRLGLAICALWTDNELCFFLALLMSLPGRN